MRARANQRHFGGKRDSRRHSTRSFSENVVVAGTSYQVLEVLSFCGDRERVEPPLRKITVLTFLEKKRKIKLSGLSFLRIREKNLTSNLLLEVFLVFESNGLSWHNHNNKIQSTCRPQAYCSLRKERTVHNIRKSSNFVLL